MFVLNKSNQKPVLEYPCRWVYKVIGCSGEKLREVIAQIVQDHPYTVTLSNTSSTGKYCCMNVEIVVSSEAVRIALYETIRNHPAVKIVL